VDHYQVQKKNQTAYGDMFHSRKIPGSDRIISVLSDGLGSGIKACVLSTLTATMVSSFISNNIDIRRAAGIIMETLPVCSVRKIGYSTFTIIDMDQKGFTRIIEHDNPPFILMRNGRPFDIPKEAISAESNDGREISLFYSSFRVVQGDRIIIFSDGISQSGMGKRKTPLGWGNDGAGEYLTQIIGKTPEISAGECAKKLVGQALVHDGFKASDDITCGVIYIRKPRRIMVFTGPPFQSDRDKELAHLARDFNGKKVICGGTTAKIIARELNKQIMVNLADLDFDPDLPPCSTMDGFDLITEGTITLGKVLGMLESGEMAERKKINSASKLIKMLLDSDIIEFIVGTRINDAHQDPSLPVELEIRRNLVKRICSILKEKHLKETSFQFI
jgi:hypothetical protein